MLDSAGSGRTRFYCALFLVVVVAAVFLLVTAGHAAATSGTVAQNTAGYTRVDYGWQSVKVHGSTITSVDLKREVCGSSFPVKLVLSSSSSPADKLVERDGYGYSDLSTGWVHYDVGTVSVTPESTIYILLQPSDMYGPFGCEYPEYAVGIASLGDAYAEGSSSFGSGLDLSFAMTGEYVAPPPNHDPPAPSNNGPANGATVTTVNPTLRWIFGTEVDGDFQYASVHVVNEGGWTVGDCARAKSATSCYVPGLSWGSNYSWTVYVDDNRGGSSSSTWTFKTNAAPTSPSLSAPSSGASNLAPPIAFSWGSSTDPEADSITYRVFVDSGSGPFVACNGGAGTSCTWSGSSRGTTYNWWVEAKDSWGATQTSSMRAMSTRPNGAPGVATLNSPANNAGNQAPPVTLSWTLPTDPDGDAVQAAVKMDLGTADPTTTVCSFTTSMTSCQPPTPVIGGTYTWKVIVQDLPPSGTAGSSTTAPRSFTMTRAPNTPSGATPAGGATNIGWTPTFTVSNTGDPDGDTVTYKIEIKKSTDPDTAYFQTCSMTAPTLSCTASTGTPLLRNLQYTWRVRAVETHNLDAYSGTKTFTTQPNSYPAVPSSPGSPGNGGINAAYSPTPLSWTNAAEPDGDPIQVEVFVGTTNPPPTTTAACSGLSLSTCNVSTVKGTQYYWRLRVTDNQNPPLSTLSPVFSFITHRDPNVPTHTSPLSPLNTNLDWHSVDIKWNGGDPDGDAVSYVVKGLINGAGPVNLCTKAASATTAQTCTLTTLQRGATYSWYVIATDSWGLAKNSAYTDFTTKPNNPPAAVTLPSPADGATNQNLALTLSWSGAVDLDSDAITYRVLMDGAPAGSATPNPTTLQCQGGGTSCAVSGLNPNWRYNWRVEADDGFGGSSSAFFSFVTKKIAPWPPTNTQAVAAYTQGCSGSSCPRIELTWGPPTNAGGGTVSQYKVFRGTTPGGEIYLTTVSATSFTDTPVTPGTMYYYAVQAVNEVGPGNGGDEVSARPYTLPGTPAVTVQGGLGKLTLTWTTPTDGWNALQHYRIERDSGSGTFVSIKTVPPGVNTFDDATSPNHGALMKYRISALNDAGYGPAGAGQGRAFQDVSGGTSTHGFTCGTLTSSCTTIDNEGSPNCSKGLCDCSISACDGSDNLGWTTQFGDDGSFEIAWGELGNHESVLYADGRPYDQFWLRFAVVFKGGIPYDSSRLDGARVTVAKLQAVDNSGAWYDVPGGSLQASLYWNTARYEWELRGFSTPRLTAQDLGAANGETSSFRLVEVLDSTGGSVASTRKLAIAQLVARPIAFVHGIDTEPDLENYTHPATWAPGFASALADSASIQFGQNPWLWGLGAQMNVNFNAIQDIRYAGADVRDEVARLASAEKPVLRSIAGDSLVYTGSVDVVAHSLGGLVSRYYVEDLLTDEQASAQIAHLVTTGTPHLGVKDTSRMLYVIDWEERCLDGVTGAEGDEYPTSRSHNAGHSNAANDDGYFVNSAGQNIHTGPACTAAMADRTDVSRISWGPWYEDRGSPQWGAFRNDGYAADSGQLDNETGLLNSRSGFQTMKDDYNPFLKALDANFNNHDLPYFLVAGEIWDGFSSGARKFGISPGGDNDGDGFIAKKSALHDKRGPACTYVKTGPSANHNSIVKQPDVHERVRAFLLNDQGRAAGNYGSYGCTGATAARMSALAAGDDVGTTNMSFEIRTLPVTLENDTDGWAFKASWSMSGYAEAQVTISVPDGDLVNETLELIRPDGSVLSPAVGTTSEAVWLPYVTVLEQGKAGVVLTTPVDGVWQIRIGNAHSARFAWVDVSGISRFGMESLSDGFVAVGDEALFRARVSNDGEPVTDAEVFVRLPYEVGDAATKVYTRDDGVAPDEVAGDGIYTGSHRFLQARTYYYEMETTWHGMTRVASGQIAAHLFPEGWTPSCLLALPGADPGTAAGQALDCVTDLVGGTTAVACVSAALDGAVPSDPTRDGVAGCLPSAPVIPRLCDTGTVGVWPDCSAPCPLPSFGLKPDCTTIPSCPPGSSGVPPACATTAPPARAPGRGAGGAAGAGCFLGIPGGLLMVSHGTDAAGTDSNLAQCWDGTGWTTMPPAIFPRSQVAAVGMSAAPGLPGGYWVIGGKGPACGATVCSTVERFNGMWTTAPPLPKAAAGLAAAADPTAIYVFGGRDCTTAYCSSTPMNDLQVFHPGPNVWTSGPTMPVGRQDHAVAVNGPPGCSPIYVIGGNNGPTGGTSVAGVTLASPAPTDIAQIDRFDPCVAPAGKWKPSAIPDLPTPVSEASAAWCNGRLFVLGGLHGGAATTALQIYDPASKKWASSAWPTATYNEAGSQFSDTMTPGAPMLLAGYPGDPTAETFPPGC